MGTLIKNGTIIDGTGSRRYRGDVWVEGDRIADIGLLSGAQADTVIDAAGCVVAPGFVDMHSHVDFTLFPNPTSDSLVRQGITSAVAGNCGASLAPLLPDTRAQIQAFLETNEPAQPWDRWSTFAGYLDCHEQSGMSLNLSVLVGQGTVRASVMGYGAGAANADQLAQMREQVRLALDAGAPGLSTGLIYPPGSYADTKELIEVARPVGRRNGFYSSHIRGESATLLQAVGEAITIGRETGARVHISHFKAAGDAYWPLASEALQRMDRARADGVDVTADMYPYLAGSTGLVYLLPEASQVGGRAAVLRRLLDPEARKEIARLLPIEGTFRHADWSQIMISSALDHPEYQGRFIDELASEAGKSPCDWMFDALIATRLSAWIIVFQVSEANVAMQLRCPFMTIGTDSEGLAAEGPLSHGLPHPRNYGTFPRLLRRYVREQRVLSLEEAVRMSSGAPAATLGWPDRGLLKKGLSADLVVFDPETVADRATFEAPHQYPVGIHHVLVNGQAVVAGGVHTGARPGRVLRARG